MKYVVCYSGGHSSAQVAVEAVKKAGKENVILLNHDISSKVEHEDIKRFKREVAQYLDLEVTQANMDNYQENIPLKIARDNKAFQAKPGRAFCTNRLKTRPFHKWLEDNCSGCKTDYSILYGFDANEEHRISNRKIIMRSMGYETEYPLANWERTITCTEDIDIRRPVVYKLFGHANCMGCLKAGKQHRYAVYMLRPDISQEAVETEKYIGYSIIKNNPLIDFIPLFEEMKARGICPNDKMVHQTFWAKVNKFLKDDNEELIPCDCSF